MTGGEREKERGTETRGERETESGRETEEEKQTGTEKNRKEGKKNCPFKAYTGDWWDVNIY